MRTDLLRPIFALAAMLLACPAAFAQGGPQVAGARQTMGAPLQGLPDADTLGERVERLWDDVAGFFSLRGTASYYMQRTSRQEQGRMRDDLTSLMSVAGYKLKEIESSLGLIPSLQMTFGQARELTDADRDYVERFLERHAMRHPGPVAALQRMIVRSVLDASDMQGLAVDKVEIDVLPLPRVKIIIAPADAPLGLDAARILRSIDGLNRRLQQLPAQRGGLDGVLPAPEPAIRPAAAAASSL
jgi:hypothetical protein